MNAPVPAARHLVLLRAALLFRFATRAVTRDGTSIVTSVATARFVGGEDLRCGSDLYDVAVRDSADRATVLETTFYRKRDARAR